MGGRGIITTGRLGEASGHQDPAWVPGPPEGRHSKVLWEKGREQVAGHSRQNPPGYLHKV